MVIRAIIPGLGPGSTPGNPVVLARPPQLRSRVAELVAPRPALALASRDSQLQTPDKLVRATVR